LGVIFDHFGLGFRVFRGQSVMGVSQPPDTTGGHGMLHTCHIRVEEWITLRDDGRLEVIFGHFSEYRVILGLNCVKITIIIIMIIIISAYFMQCESIPSQSSVRSPP